MRRIVTAAWLWDGTELIVDPILEIDDIAEGRIVAVGSRASRELPRNVETVDFPDALLAPAFFDIHIHGGAGHDVMEATPEALATIGRFLASRGTASFLATTVTAPMDQTLRSLEGLAQQIGHPENLAGARPIGIHLEGPFLSHAKRGVHPPQHLLAPSIAVFDRMFEAARGHIRLMTLAPELPNAAELSAHATARGVRISVGHSNATAAETWPAIAAGAVSATHTFNAMRPLDHREPGILGTVLSNDALYAELICDGIHVDPSLVKVWWRAKGGSRAILVTDAMAATGMPDGEYHLGGFPVQLSLGRATASGVLAGSVLTLDRAVQNFIAYTGATLQEAIPLVTQNPANMTGLANATGKIQSGSAASFVVLASDGTLLASVIQGKLQGPAKNSAPRKIGALPSV